MDETDSRMMLLVCADPRISVGELAKRLGLSRQTANNRVQALAKKGVFKNIKAEINFLCLDCVLVRIWGVSRTRSATDILDRLGENDCTAHACIAGGNEVFVLGCPKRISDLGGYVDFVKRAAEIAEPTVGILDFEDGVYPLWTDGGARRKSYRPPSSLDYRIVASLREDARKPLGKIAEEVGASARTVRRRIDAMKADGILGFYEVGALTEEESRTYVCLTLRKGSDKVKVGKRLSLINPTGMFMLSFSNLPSTLMALILSNSIGETRHLLERIRNDEDVLSAVPNLMYLERNYETWDVKDLFDKARNARSGHRKGNSAGMSRSRLRSAPSENR